jgi:hypothetical protein
MIKAAGEPDLRPGSSGREEKEGTQREKKRGQETSFEQR